VARATIRLAEPPPSSELGREAQAVVVHRVSKTFRLLHERQITVKQRLLRPRSLGGTDRLRSLDDVSFEIAQGECFGIAGRNGSGKSTLLRCISGIYPPDSGNVVVAGRVAPFIELGVGFNPELPSRENATLNAMMLGLSRAEATARFPAMLAFGNLEEFVDQPLKNYSSGMLGRLAFAVTVHVDAEVFLFDEVFAVGDLAFREKCVQRFATLREQRKTIVLVTHDMSLIRSYCDRALLLERGRLAEIGKPDVVADAYDDMNRASGAPRSSARGPSRAEAGGSPKPPPARRPLLGNDPRRFPTLTHALAVTDFRLKYVGTVLNYLWAIARPFAMFGVLLLIFTRLGRFQNGVAHYSTYLLMSVVLWTFFLQATSAAVQSLVHHDAILRRVPLPPLVIPISLIESALFDLALNFVAVLGFGLAAGVLPQAGWLEMPLLVLVLAVLTSGVSILLSALHVRFRDTNQIWLVVSQAIFYLTPIFYVASAVPGSLSQLIVRINPIATVLTEARHAFVDSSAPTAAEAAGGAVFLLIPLAVVAATVAAGLWVFRREGPRAAENL
jgi:ABC-type polysaccharide/polyol phosphate transport system ATPase subunit/ABC-type polysaccharide/polyol phosphate export permease